MGKPGTDRIGHHNPGAGRVLAQISSDACDRASGPDPRHQNIHVPLRVLENLRPGRLAVDFRIRRILELLQQYKPVGIGGIPLSTAIVSLVTTFALAAVLRRLIGGLDATRTLAVAVRIVIASAALAGAALAARELLDGALSQSNGDQLLVVLGAGATGLAAYGLASAALRIEEAREVAGLVRGQLGRLR